MILCGRSVFESERSEELSYAADGATVDEIVEGVLQAILTQVEENVQALGDDCSCDVGSSGSSFVDGLLKAITAVDPQRLAAAVCDGGLVHGTRKSLQSMVLVVPTDVNGANAAAAADDIYIVSMADGFPMRRDGSFITGSQTLPPPAAGESTDGHADGSGTASFTLTSSIIPSPIHATQLRSDGFYRAVFCDDLERGTSTSIARGMITPIDYLKMRWALLRRGVLGGNGARRGTAAHTAMRMRNHNVLTAAQRNVQVNVRQTAEEEEEDPPAAPTLPTSTIADVITERQPLLPSVTHASAGRAFRNANDTLRTLYPQQSAAVLRSMLHAEAQVFGDGPPQRTSTLNEADEARRRADYFNAVGAPLFGGGHMRR